MKASRLLAGVAGLALAAAFAATPVLAQTAGAPTTAPGAAPAPANAPGTGVGSTAPGTATGGPALGTADTTAPAGAAAGAHTTTPNPVLTTDGQVRASKVIGAAVYNEKDQKLASVDDILLDKDQKATQAVLSVGGVLGVGGKLVVVPYDHLKFPDQVGNTTSRVMLQGETPDALNGMPTFHYASK